MRVKRGLASHAKHKKLLKLTKGYQGTYHKNVKRAKEALWHAGDYSARHRKRRAADFRTLWIQRINAALQPHDIKYSRFINMLLVKNIKLNRKVLASLALDQVEVFNKIVEFVKQ